MTKTHDQEVRRQAMLQAMQLDVWLPRQQLHNAAQSRDYLLEWRTEDTVVTVSAVPTVQPVAKLSSVAAQTSAPAAVRGQAYVSVRDKLAALQAAQPAATVPLNAVVEAAAAESMPAVIEAVAVQTEPIPRFALQLLRADNCLILVDLPTGQPFQSRDPDYQLLKDMLRAAGLTDKPA